MTRTRLIFIFCTLLVLGVAVKLVFFSSKNASKAYPNLTVTVVSPEQKTVANQVNATGSTVPRDQNIVLSEISGVRLSQVMVDAGDVVKKGQVLAELDDESLNNQLEQIKSQYDGLFDEYSRSDKLKDTGAISKAALMQKRVAMEAAKAKLEDAELNLRRSKIVAPADGLVYQSKADVGTIVNANQPLFLIAQNGEIEFEALIPEAQLSTLKKDMAVVVKLSGQEKPLQGKVRLITPQIDSSSRMATIRVHFVESKDLPVGLFGQAFITTNEVSGLSIPATALQEDPEGLYVLVLNEKHIASRVPVTVKMRNSDVVIVEGVAPDAVIVARAGAFVKEGDSVNVGGGK